MELKLERDVRTEEFSLGRLFVDGEEECFTVEDRVRPAGEKVHGETAIPAGRYKVIITMSPRFKRMLPLLVDVPGFEGIRIHPGNDAGDTEGCILPGRRRTQDGVGESRLAFDALYNKIGNALDSGEEVWITVGAPGDAPPD